MSEKMQQVTALCKRRGFVFAGSDIYGGLANTWDYGPYGAQLKKNIQDFWWKTFVEDRDDVIGLDSGILMNPKVWEASGHLANFSDPLMDCKKCNERVRADKLVEEKLDMIVDGKPDEEIHQIVMANKLACPACGELAWTVPRAFNLMFKTSQGVIEGEGSDVYLRPETAQGIFVNFKNVIDSTRVRVPFGIAQVGKAFRNEITPGNFVFRTREFEQMEIEYFVHPDNYKDSHQDWIDRSKQWFLDLGISEENLRLREHDADELSHYASRTVDVEYKFPFGWGELQGVAHRSNYDLTQHASHSGQKLEYRDPHTNEVYVPHVIEPSWGLTRTLLTVLLDAYEEEELEGGETRTVMHFDPKIAPVQVAVFPLHKKLNDDAHNLYAQLKRKFRAEYDDSGAIGKRYRRQDEIGTPYCVTFDFDSLEDNAVTVRNRDTMEQQRVAVSELEAWLEEKLSF